MGQKGRGDQQKQSVHGNITVKSVERDRCGEERVREKKGKVAVVICVTQWSSACLGCILQYYKRWSNERRQEEERKGEERKGKGNVRTQAALNVM